ncbi:MAG: sodium:proton antiporter, partial [Lachnospiraceae bacterium]|nr:sodium:proton antiporter [Lachnospiraceae bacterium]
VHRILFVLGICGMIFGSVAAIRENNVNRMVAFSSAAQIGYIYAGIGIGGLYGYTAAIFHIMMHAVTKSLLFLTTPRLAEVSEGSLRFRNLTGAALRDRNAGVAFLIGSFSMIGIPVFAGFSSKMLFGVAAVRSEEVVPMTVLMLALAASSMLNAVYFMRTLIRLYDHKGPGGEKVRSLHRADYNVPVLMLTAMNMFLGLASGVVVNLIETGLKML